MPLEKISRDVIIATTLAACGPNYDQAPEIVLVRALARYCTAENKDLEAVIAHLREAFDAYKDQS